MPDTSENAAGDNEDQITMKVLTHRDRLRRCGKDCYWLRGIGQIQTRRRRPGVPGPNQQVIQATEMGSSEPMMMPT